jgi:uncharacterized protein (TIGR03790 family)
MIRCGVCFLLLVLLASGPVAHGNIAALQAHLLVVYNKDAADSERLARYYAEKRHIPEERIYGLHCSNAEQITRAEYDDTIRNPLETYFKAKGWIKRDQPRPSAERLDLKVEPATANEIWAIVLVRGIPFKVANDPALLAAQPPLNERFASNAAAVDSELATFPIKGSPITGFVANPYHFAGYLREFDEYDAKKLILVTRLDGPTAADVQRMIDDSLYAEQHRLSGLVCLDARGITDPKSNYIIGDQWLRHCAMLFQQDGFPVEFDDQPGVFAENLPWNEVAFYAGWYSDNARGFFLHEPRRFARGALVYHIHSYSAATMRDRTQNWVAPLINAGASAALGSVFEPYLILMPHADIFAGALLQGYTFAEAAYQSQAALSWMITVVGDPLYRPFAVQLPEALAQADAIARTQSYVNEPFRDRLALQQFRRNLSRRPENLTRASLEGAILRPDSTFVAWEGIGDLLSKADAKPAPTDLAELYRKAFETAPTEIDQIRVGLKLANAYTQGKQSAPAENILTLLEQRFPKEAGFYGIGPNNQAPPLIVSPPVSAAPLDLTQVPKPPGPPAPTRR